ncbi:hypothetical protein swp_0855 [Shewanella piezotolerans WP3]|uniref:Uncharacterized protein n=1 Tax=Shewanella piezotolerans (strain WP3 / JCM 13877) TaxID=225849 RepID=B8CJW1_SHEPW|nr:hypothetical protein swp_0855 [Shewanella piezotolerans WP3]
MAIWGLITFPDKLSKNIIKVLLLMHLIESTECCDYTT